MSGFWKSGSNLSCDLLIFDPGPIAHLYPKKAQIKRIVIIFSIESCKEIGFFDFGQPQGVHWGQSWTKNSNFGYILPP